MKAAATTVLAGAVTPREECGTGASDSPAALTDSAATGAEPDIEYPGGGMPVQAWVSLPASCWKVRGTHTKADEETRGAPNIKGGRGKLRYMLEQTFALLQHFKRLAVCWGRRAGVHDAGPAVLRRCPFGRVEAERRPAFGRDAAVQGAQTLAPQRYFSAIPHRRYPNPQE